MENISQSRLVHCSVFADFELLLEFCEHHSLLTKLSVKQKKYLFKKLRSQSSELEPFEQTDSNETSRITTYQYTL